MGYKNIKHEEISLRDLLNKDLDAIFNWNRDSTADNDFLVYGSTRKNTINRRVYWGVGYKLIGKISFENTLEIRLVIDKYALSNFEKIDIDTLELSDESESV